MKIVAIEPPFTAEHGVLFGLQSKYGGVADPQPAAETTEFHTHIDVRAADFGSDHVQGRRGDRFIYLS